MSDSKPNARILSVERIHEMGKEMLEIVNEEYVWHLSEVTERWGSPPYFIYELQRAYPEFVPYYERAKAILGRKMLGEAMQRKADTWVIRSFMPRLLNERENLMQDVEEEEYRRNKGKVRAVQGDGITRGIIHEFIDSMKVDGDEEAHAKD